MNDSSRPGNSDSEDAGQSLSRWNDDGGSQQKKVHVNPQANNDGLTEKNNIAQCCADLDMHSTFEKHPVGVLVIHGFTSTPQSMKPLAIHLAEAGHLVAQPLLAGHGTTVEDLAATPYQSWIRDVLRDYDSLAETCQKVFVVGMSMGGALATIVAARRPDVAGMALINPAVYVDSPLAPLAPLLKHVMPTTKAIGSAINDPDAKEVCYDRVPTAAVEQLNSLFKVARQDFDFIECDTMIFRSEVDDVVNNNSLFTIQKNLRDTDLETVYLQNSNHVATLDYDKQIIAVDIEQFINERTFGKVY